MIKLRRLAFLALLAVFMAIPSCGTVTFPDVWAALKKCDNVSWALASEVFADVVEIAQGNPAGEADLATMLAADTVGAVPCVLDYLDGQGGKVGAAAAKFKAAHAPEISKARARGGATSMRCPAGTMPIAPTCTPTSELRANPGDRLPGASPAVGGAPRVPAAGPKEFAYSGENPGHALARCYRECGDNAHGAIAPPGHCECWRKVGATWRWVAAR